MDKIRIQVVVPHDVVEAGNENILKESKSGMGTTGMGALSQLSQLCLYVFWPVANC